MALDQATDGAPDAQKKRPSDFQGKIDNIRSMQRKGSSLQSLKKDYEDMIGKVSEEAIKMRTEWYPEYSDEDLQALGHK